MPKPLQIDHKIDGDGLVYLVSDIHMGDGTPSDIFVGKDREFIDFLAHARAQRAHLVVAGDFIDFQQAWSMSRVLRAHGRVFRELSRYADDLGVTYIWGNHDADITLFKDLLRFDVCSSLEIGDQVLVRHGYEYDPWIGPHLEASHLATQIHHLVERVLGTWIRLPLQNFYTRSNRVTFWTFHKFSLLLKARVRLSRALGLDTSADRTEAVLRYWAHNQLGDAAGMFEPIRTALLAGPHRFIVTGHSHLPGQVQLGPDRTYVNTGSWTFNSATYAVWDGHRFTVSDWLSGREFGDRSYRALVERSFRHLDFLDWWRQEYLGWLNFRCGDDHWHPSLHVDLDVDLDLDLPDSQEHDRPRVRA